MKNCLQKTVRTLQWWTYKAEIFPNKRHQKHFSFRFMHYSTKKFAPQGFSLLEILITIAISGIVLVSAFDALSKVVIFRSSIVANLSTDSEMYTAMERLVTLIKNGGTIDYEEYWDRAAVGTGMVAGHYATPSGYGNYGNGGTVGDTSGTPASFGGRFYPCGSKTVPGDIGTQ